MIELARKTQQPLLKPESKQQAASHPSASVWVNASAGSGKTTVLTQRVMRLLLDGVAPEKILCLTYTRAAAAEMANRITGKLSLFATCSDNELSTSLSDLQGYAPSTEQMLETRRLFAKLLACPGGMRIRTLHAFCQEILRRFPIEAGLAPHFSVIEEAETKALQEDVLRDLLIAAGDYPESVLGAALKTLVLAIGEFGFHDAVSSVLAERPRLQAALAKTGNPDNLIQQMRGLLQLVPQDTVAALCEAAVQDSALAKADLAQAAQWLLEGSKSIAPRGEKIRGWLKASAAERVAQFDLYCRCFFTGEGEPYKSFANKDLLAKYPQLAVILDREVMRLQSVIERMEMAQLAESTAALVHFGAAFLEKFQARKAEQAALDYDDLIIRTDALLKRPGIAPWILFKLDGGIDHLLVDEAQDTSRAQWDIVAHLADEFFTGTTARSGWNRTLFVVGDEKQSIFSFQRADPEAFRGMRAYFAQRINEAEKIYREVPMRVSYRSAPAVLQAVDAVFAVAKAVSGVSSEPVEHVPAPLRAGESQKRGRIEIWPLQPAANKDNDPAELWAPPLGYEKEQDPQAELAQHIAAKIRTKMEAGAWQAGDIMILLRRRGRFADLMVRALKEQNVPVTGVDRMCLVKQLPVMDLLALMQFVLLPEDDLNLAALLRGPLLNLSEDNLMKLAIGRSGTLWQSLKDKHDQPAFADVFSYLLRWLNDADFTTPFAFLSSILNEACPGSNISGKHGLWRRLGPDSIDPVEELLNAAQLYSRSHTPSLQNFLHWLNATEAEIKRELDRGGGQVRIMTVHAAKGLEAPIVFLPDSASLPRTQDVPKFLWGDQDIPLFAPRRPNAGIARHLWEAARQRQMEEYRRLFYVALTRSANELYIAGWESARKEGNSNESWYNLALTALQNKHQPSLADVTPQPIVAFADPDLAQEKKVKPAKPTKAKIIVPDWVSKKLETPSQTPAARRISATPATATPDSFFTRGRIMHRLLQSLPNIAVVQRAEVAARFLANPQHQLTEQQQSEIAKEVLSVINHELYAPLFAPASRAEVPLVGTIKGESKSGQVDRLCHLGDEIWIVDYKTNRPPPERVEDVAEAYRRQLADYRVILKAIYPDKAIRCFLLWTYKLQLMELPEAFLTDA